MKTSTEFKNNIKNGIVTPKMLAMAIFSYNKRAKNMRDKERIYRNLNRNYYFFDYHNYEEKYQEKKEDYYKKKEELLAYIQPIEIHHVLRYHYNYYTEEEETIVEKYLYFKIDDFSFHTPLKNDQEESQFNLPITEIDDLQTFGHDIENLMSVQMCDKIRLGLQNGSLILLNNNK